MKPMPASGAAGCAGALLGDFVSAPLGTIEAVLDLLAVRFEFVGIGFRNPDQLARNGAATAERQAERRTIPALELDATAVGDGNRQDRPARSARKHDNAETGNPRHPRDVGGQGGGKVFLPTLGGLPR